MAAPQAISPLLAHAVPRIKRQSPEDNHSTKLNVGPDLSPNPLSGPFLATSIFFNRAPSLEAALHESSGSFHAFPALGPMQPQATNSASTLNFTRQGAGKPLLMLHGLGGNIASWDNLAADLARTNEVIALDLPGHGASPVTPGSSIFGGMADEVADFIRAKGLEGIAAVGMSLGGRVVLEMARRGFIGATVALAPGGFWNDRERKYLKASLLASGNLVRTARPALRFLTRYKAGRAALLAQISAKPGQVPQEAALRELRSFANIPTFKDLVRDLAEGPTQEGTASTPGPVTIVWGRKDRLLLPRQAEQALQAFPEAQLHWVDQAGHYISWDAPDEALHLIRQGTGAMGSTTSA